ncbi:hypothetical protein FHT72_006965 [Rhizobium sp. BK077]|jgi:hypothetical protein|uniref:hypothetical protein n=1 Tax=unclassified Rhizobium TaxID=2613769 RepID=UPI00161F3D87|nr:MULTISPECIES: hypothetical protein [unclassified Rhizobium]MBB3303311.1 hypothetical protein [Rhizobium sp. BK112]MBB3372426.1 hypothetical protein [Rhizobium sp. BK077]MBB4183169.1 hypothetical protein [Rhizobium sp. BK109]
MTDNNSDDEIKITLDDMEVVEQVEITNPEIVKRIKELKDAGVEGWKVSIEKT